MLKIALFLQALVAHSYEWTDENDGFETSIPYKIALPSPKKATQELPADDTKLNLNLKEIVLSLSLSILLNLTLTLLLVYSCVCKKKQEPKCQCEQLQQLV